MKIRIRMKCCLLIVIFFSFTLFSTKFIENSSGMNQPNNDHFFFSQSEDYYKNLDFSSYFGGSMYDLGYDIAVS